MTCRAARLQIYVLYRALGGAGVALVIVSAIVILVNFVEISRTIGLGTDAGFARLAQLTLFKSPSVILQMLPFAFLFGSMGTFVTLNRRGELTAMRAAGASAWTFILPAAGAAFAVGVASTLVLSPLAAGLAARFEDGKLYLGGDAAAGATADVWLRQADAEGQMIMHARARDTTKGVLRLSGVTIYIMNAAPTGGASFDRRIDADEALLTPGIWRLAQARESRAGAEAIRSEALSLPAGLDRRAAMETVVAPAAVGFWELPGIIRAAERSGDPASAYRLRFHQLLAAPLLLAGMTILAASFSLRLIRLGHLATLGGIGIASGFLVFLATQLCGAMGANHLLPAPLAAWAPPLLAALSGATVLCYTEDG